MRIDWAGLAANSLWILGLSLALAAFSYAGWQASLKHEKLRTSLAHPKIQRALDTAGILFCAGSAATSEATWQTVLWGILAGLFVLSLVSSLFVRKSAK